MEIFLEGGEHAVLLIHGLTGNPSEIAYLAKRLHKEGFTVKVPCLAGHCTNIQDLKKTKWQDWYNTVLQNFKELKKEYKSVSVAGLSAGALLALYLAYKQQDEISAVALISTLFFYDGWAMPWYSFILKLVCATPLRYIMSYKEKDPYGIKNERLRKQVEKMMEGEVIYPEFPAVSLCEYLKFVKIVKKILPQITTPTIAIHSIEDDMASLKNIEYLEKNIGSKRFCKVLVENSYHVIIMDNDREKAIKEVIEFFKEVIVEG